jgi:hypothetical protein
VNAFDEAEHIRPNFNGQKNNCFAEINEQIGCMEILASFAWI